MKKHRKTEHLQIRVSPAQKLAIQKQAGKARMTMSEWILDKAVPSPQLTFQELLGELAAAEKPSLVFGELLELLGPMSAEEYESAVAGPPWVELDPYWQNYVAATVEHAAASKRAAAPAWTREIPPLDEPVFGSSLKSVRLHLLVNSPPAFAQRNIFIDSTVGDRV